MNKFKYQRMNFSQNITAQIKIMKQYFCNSVISQNNSILWDHNYHLQPVKIYSLQDRTFQTHVL